MILNGEYVERLSDEELCMLEQLTYLDEMVAEKAGIIDSVLLSSIILNGGNDVIKKNKTWI